MPDPVVFLRPARYFSACYCGLRPRKNLICVYRARSRLAWQAGASEAGWSVKICVPKVFKQQHLKKREPYNIQYPGTGAVFALDLPANIKPGGVARGRPTAADSQIRSGWRPAYLKLGFALHAVDGLCAQGPNTLVGESDNISPAL